MSEHSKIEAAAPADKSAMPPRRKAASPEWGADFVASEHPETARHRIQHDFIMTVSGLSREAVDKRYTYLQRLIDKAKEELGHARNASNEMRLAAMQSNLDELVAYLAGHGIHAKLPNRNGEKGPISIAHYFVIDEVPAFMGELGFLIDQWYEKEMVKVHDELLKLTGLAARVR
ncbi:MAG: hypothetical protein IE933_14200 [Sphingomonadales bacterium]|nr:hypothetical protein [Sphingomonadales bacterium]MBD3772928.1 hypothetical protein [Paracoccaceae bacterium]